MKDWLKKLGFKEYEDSYQRDEQQGSVLLLDDETIMAFITEFEHLCVEGNLKNNLQMFSENIRFSIHKNKEHRDSVTVQGRDMYESIFLNNQNQSYTSYAHTELEFLHKSDLKYKVRQKISMKERGDSGWYQETRFWEESEIILENGHVRILSIDVFQY